MEEIKVLTNLNLGFNQLLNAVVEKRSSAPSFPKVGQIYYNTVDKVLYVFDGEKWQGGGVVDPVDGGTF